MASRLEGGQNLRRALRRLPEENRRGVAKAIDESLALLRRTALTLVPVGRKGRLIKALASPSAIGKREKGMRGEFGYRTKGLRKKAWHAHFAEFGTKGYAPGALRRRSGAVGLGRFRPVVGGHRATKAQPHITPLLAMLGGRIVDTVRKAVFVAVRNVSTRSWQRGR